MDGWSAQPAPQPALEGIEPSEIIGSGGSGTVWKCWQPRFKRWVAVKLIDTRLDSRAEASFARECSALGELSGHPNIVAVYDGGLDRNGRPYLVMPFLSGGSLADVLERDGPLDWPRACRLMAKVSQAMQAAHEAGILHRDIKPENMLLTQRGEPQLADFGIAHVAGAAMTSSKTVHATPIHASPEVLSSQPATELSDIYGLASSLYRLIAGTPAFYNADDESIFALLVRIGTEEPGPLSAFGVPDRLAEAVHRGMAKVPTERFPTAGDFAQELFDVLSEPVAAPAPPALEVDSAQPTGAMAIEGYSDLVQVGSGGFSVVYRARETAFDRVVAIKVLAGTAWGDDVQARFERECRAIGALSWHPNIVTVYAAGQTASGAPYLVMEYAPGGSVGAALARKGALTWTDAIDIGVQAAGAVEAAHRAGRIHRDLKPENLLVSQSGAVMLGDFGISALASATATRTSGITASIAHAAPEILDGERATRASDVYSLASLVYALVAGRPAFVSDTDQSLGPLFRRIALSPPPDLRDRGVPDELCTALESAMAKEPAARPVSAFALGEALQDVKRRRGLAVPAMVTGEPVGDAAGTTVEVGTIEPVEDATTVRARKSGRRHTGLVAAGVAIALLLTGGGIALASRGGHSPQTKALAISSSLPSPSSTPTHKPAPRSVPAPRHTTPPPVQAPGNGAPVVQPKVDSHGGQPSTVPVPPVVGQSSAGASSVLRGAGFVVATNRTYNAASAGTVIGQTPAANTRIQPGSTVTIVVSLGPKPPNPPPNLPPQPNPNNTTEYSFSMNSCYPSCPYFYFRMTDDFVDPEGNSWKATDFRFISGPGTAELTFNRSGYDCSKGCFIFYPTDGRNTPQTFKVQCRATDPGGSKTSGRVLSLSITYYYS